MACIYTWKCWILEDTCKSLHWRLTDKLTPVRVILITSRFCRVGFSWLDLLTIHRRPRAVHVPIVSVSVVSKAHIYFWWRPLPKSCFWRQWAIWNMFACKFVFITVTKSIQKCINEIKGLACFRYALLLIFSSPFPLFNTTEKIPAKRKMLFQKISNYCAFIIQFRRAYCKQCTTETTCIFRSSKI